MRRWALRLLLVHGRWVVLLARGELVRVRRRRRGSLVHPHFVHPTTKTGHHAFRAVQEFLKLAFLAVEVCEVSLQIHESRNGRHTALW